MKENTAPPNILSCNANNKNIDIKPAQAEYHSSSSDITNTSY